MKIAEKLQAEEELYFTVQCFEDKNFLEAYKLDEILILRNFICPYYADASADKSDSYDNEDGRNYGEVQHDQHIQTQANPTAIEEQLTKKVIEADKENHCLIASII